MQVYYNLEKSLEETAVALGFFDGVHTGSNPRTPLIYVNPRKINYIVRASCSIKIL